MAFLAQGIEHRWDVSPGEAIEIQKQLAAHVETADRLPNRIARVAGVDVGFRAGGTLTRAAIAVLSFPELRLLDQAVAEIPTTFPYVPGLLSFREIPAILAALAKLPSSPDLLLVDGQGYAHPRRCGLASHLGLVMDIPSLGVGKTRLVGVHDEPANRRGARARLIDKDEWVGWVVRTRVSVKPVYISVGHRLSHESAVNWAMRCTGRYRLPEPIRQAHRLASG